MSILDKIPSLAENELFQKLAAIEDITALCKEDQEKYDDAIKVMRDHIAAYKGAIIEAKIEVAKNMLMENEPVDKIARYTGLSEEELLRRIIEYKKYKEMSKKFKEMFLENNKRFYNFPLQIELPKQ